MTRYIVDALSRLRCPAPDAVAGRHLRVRRRSDYAEPDAFLHPVLPADKSFILRLKYASFDRVPDVVAECANPVDLCHIGLQSLLRGRDRAVPASPALAVHHDRGIDPVERCTHRIHRPDIVHCHQVKTETVNVVLRRPVDNRIHDVLAHHGMVGSCLVSTGGRIGIAPANLSVVVIRHRFLKI